MISVSPVTVLALFAQRVEGGHAGADWAAWHMPGGPVGPPARWTGVR